MRGGGRRGRRQGRRGGGPRPGSLLRSELIVALLTGGPVGRSSHRYHLAATSQRAPGTGQGASRIRGHSVVMGARCSPRFTSDLSPGRRVHVSLRAARRVGIRLAGGGQGVLARAQRATTADGRSSGTDWAASRGDRRAVHAERVAAQAAVTAAVLPRLQSQRGDAARRHHGTALRGRGCSMVRRVHWWPVRVMRCRRCRVRARGSRCRHR